MTPRPKLTSALLGSLLLAAAAAALQGQGPDQAARDLTPAAPAPATEQAPASAIPDHWFGPGPLHKVWIDGAELGQRSRLEAAGALVRSIDHGRFTLAIVDERAFGGRAALASQGFDFRDEMDRMVFNGIVLDGLHPEETLARLDPAERFTDPATLALDARAGLYVVQFEGPVRDEWLADLSALGVQFSQFVPMNAYVVHVPDGAVAALEALARAVPHIQYAGVYEPAFRIHPMLRSAMLAGEDAPLSVTIQLVDLPGVRDALAQIEAMADSVVQVRPVGPYLNVQALVRPVYFQTLAANRAVFQLEPRGELVALDERQGQIMAGNVNATGPSAPGYLTWLAGAGFDSSQFGSFSVNVVDSATSLTGHPDLPTGRVAFQLNPTSQSGAQDGHGFLNAGIVAGFNNGTGSAVEDTGGYNYGLGIAPFARVGATAIFGPGGLNPTSFESQAYGLGARISTNSWGFTINNNPIPDYDSNSQEYDFITRDAQSATGGNQEYLVVFSAGNDGSGANTVSTPGTAKNIITVAAGENNRQTGTDGCGIPNSGANNHQDIISFSSHGPVDLSGGDGRWKPEISAPGTHIQAGVPQSNYAGGGVCNQYWPTGQTLYGWSSGTSHSTPAVAGQAALIRQHFLNQALSAPTPAMVKAYTVNTAEYMTGAFANDTLPSNSQGMGNANMNRSVDGVARIHVDQTQLLTATGQSHVVNGSVSDGGQPFRVTLVWTDAPGPTSGAPYVNNLDLTVTIGGNTYRGNVFSGATSTTGGTSDFRNNTESVFLPAGTTGAFTVTVDAASIGGDGVPGNGDATDQDFALVVYNGTTGPAGPTASFTGTPTSGNAPLNVNFTDASTGGPTSWSWTFGDGGTSTAQNPSHTYTAAGSYSVSLTITAPGGGDTLTRTNYITVTTPPAPGISDGSFESQAAGTAPAAPWTDVFGTANVINPAGGSTGDGGMPSGGSNWLEISGAGTNNATPPSNPGGVTNPPVGGAGITQSFSYAAGVSVLDFDAAFLRNEAANSTYNDWMSVDVTDGSTWFNLYHADTFTPTPQTSSKYGFAMTAVSHVSQDLAVLFPGSTTATTFTISIVGGNAVDTIQSSIGYADDFVLSSSAPTPPSAGFTGSPTSGTVPLNVNFTDASTGSITSWSWTFGDGGTSTAQNPSHTYTAAGTYTVALTVTGPGGADTLTRTNYITASAIPAPTASFTGSPTSGTAPLNVNFTDSSTGSITSWSWTFGDGGTSTAQNPSHIYTANGTYSVALTVTGPGGGDTLTRTGYITVSAVPAPVANFTGAPTSGTVPLNVNFTDASTGSITSWSWTFGDGGTSTAQNPSHTYTSAGTYSVSLTVTGPGGSDVLTRTNYITANEPAPVADFSGAPTSGVAPLAVNFTDASTGSVTSWAWTFGDGGTSTQTNPSHTYTAAGTYSVTLTVTGPGGSDALTRTNYIVVSPPGGGGPLYYVSFNTNTTVPGVGTVTDDDIVVYDAASGTWSWVLDGSDVELGGTDINAFHVRADGSILMSFNSSTFSVPGLTGGPNGTTVEDSDVVLFTPTSAAPNSAGTFSFYFDGSDVGLSSNSEDIDGLYEFADGSLGISTLGSVSGSGLSGGRDEDVLRFTGSFGAATSGSFAYHFDGSDVGFAASSSYDLSAVSADAAGNLLFSTVGNYSAAGGSGADEDVSRFTGSYGSATSGSAALLLDLSALGISTGEDVDGLSFR